MTELHCHMVTEEEQEEVTVLRKSWDLTDMMMPIACSVGLVLALLLRCGHELLTLFLAWGHDTKPLCFEPPPSNLERKSDTIRHWSEDRYNI